MYRCQLVSCVHTCNSKSLQHSCIQIRVMYVQVNFRCVQCMWMFLMFIQNILGGQSMPQFTHFPAYIRILWKSGFAGRMESLSFKHWEGSQGTSHTLSQKKSLFSNSHSGRKITEGNELWEWMKEGKKDNTGERGKNHTHTHTQEFKSYRKEGNQYLY